MPSFFVYFIQSFFSFFIFYLYFTIFTYYQSISFLPFFISFFSFSNTFFLFLVFYSFFTYNNIIRIIFFPKKELYMDLKSEFKSSFMRQPSLAAGISEYELLGHVYEENQDDLSAQLISVLSHGSISCQPPFAYHIRSLNCYMLLFTISGKGTIHYDGQNLDLAEKSLLFFDCRQSFSLGINSSFWNFEIYFFKLDENKCLI